jgi:NAD(P)-dependent dehydrogenase (short-subunit alcohol dehydrogenase family)
MSKQNVLITGSSSGFGELTARLLAEKGHHVVATMRGVNGKNENKARALRDWAADKGYSLEVLELDVTDQASVDAAIEQAGPIDVVVNNAGIGAAGVTETFTVEEHQKVFDVNYYGVHRVNRAVLPQMRERGSGLLIHVSSVIGRLIFPFLGPYCPTKFALEAYAESMYYEYAPLGIQSVIVEPGAYGTDFQGNLVMGGDEERFKALGDLAKAPEQMFENMTEMLSAEGAPDPNDVAVAIAGLIEMPADKRPLRTVADAISKDIAEGVNAAIAEKQQELTSRFEGKRVVRLGAPVSKLISRGGFIAAPAFSHLDGAEAYLVNILGKIGWPILPRPI